MPNPLSPELDTDHLHAWMPGKALDMATSPDGCCLAVSYLDVVRIYDMQLLAAGACEDSMRGAEVRSIQFRVRTKSVCIGVSR